ncbi:MAG: ABC transporter permease [Alkalispirochaeta sp.]
MIRKLRRPAILTVLLVATVVPTVYEPVAKILFPFESAYVYPRIPMLQLLGQHVVLSGIATAAAALVGMLVGIIVTRPRGVSLIPLVRDLAALAQTVPPVAVLVLAVPLFGFGTKPTVFALFLFSLLPILGNTITGLQQIDSGLLEASTAMGMRPWRRLVLTELPLAAPVIIAGVRTAAVISVGTATIGATIGAGGLGVVIIAGLVRDNLAFITAGALSAAMVALLVDWGFQMLTDRFIDLSS